MGMSASTHSLADRTIMITGASGGIGLALASSLRAKGCRLVLGTGRGELALVDSLVGHSVVSTEVDVTDPESISALMALAEREFGGFDGLVTAAGIMEQASIDELDLATWSRVISVNLTGTYSIVAASVSPLRRSKHAAVVMLASQLAYTGARSAIAYSASKAGILGLTRSLALELAPGIRVNAVTPGPIETPMTARHATPEWVAAKTSRLAMSRFGTPAEVASAITFLLSDESSYFTGQTLSPNGGGVMP